MSGVRSQALPLADRVQPALLVGSIGLGLAIGSMSEGLGRALGPLVSVGVFVLIYFVLLGVDLRSVAAAFANRRFVGISVGINFVLNPLVAWALGTIFLGSETDLFVGFVLFLVTPCIGWYLIFTELADGDTVLGVSLLVVNTVLQILLLPAYLWLLAGRAVTVDASTITTSVGLYLLVPLLLAAGTRWAAGRRWTGARARSDLDELTGRAGFGHLKTAILMLIVASMFASQADAMLAQKSSVVRLIAPTAAFFTITFLVAIAVARLTDMSHAHRALLVFTTSSRNSEASLAIAVTAFSSPLVALPVAIGPAIELPLLILMVRLLGRLSDEPEPTEGAPRSAPGPPIGMFGPSGPAQSSDGGSAMVRDSRTAAE